MRKRLTKRTIDGTEGGSGRPVFLWDTEINGFGCKVTSRQRVYIFQYRPFPGGRGTEKKRITIGKHGDLTPEQARKIAADFMLEVRSGGDPSYTLKRKQGVTVTELAERFLTEYLPTKKRPPRPKTMKEYERLFRRKVLPALSSKAVSAVSEGDIEKLHTSMRKTPYQANRVLEVLLQAFDQAERWGLRPRGTNPASYIEAYPEARRGAKKEVMLSSEQMADLVRAIASHEEEAGNLPACSAIRVAFWTGWRIGEVLRLEWRNLDFVRGTAKLIGTKTADEEYRQLPEEAIAVLQRVPRLAGSPYVFPGRDLVGHLTTVKRSWETIRERAGLANLDGLGALRLHDLRHNVVSWDVSRGVGLEIAGKNVGHRSRQSTEVYAHFAPSALKQAADLRAKAMRQAIERARRGEG